jgi:quercetin dioxygenase-like cupin family protein
MRLKSLVTPLSIAKTSDGCEYHPAQRRDLEMKGTRALTTLAAAAIVVAGCAGATPSTSGTSPTSAAGPAKAVGATTDNLGDGKIDALPAGTLYVQYLDVPQSVGAPITHAHIAGFVYTHVGTHRMAITGGETKDLKTGEAAFVPPNVGHTHSNPGPSANSWYFVSIRPNTARTATPTFPGQKEAFATADLAALPAGPHSLGLRVVTIQANGRTAAHKHGGMETILVLDGSVELRVQGAAMKTLQKGEGTSIQADTVLQISNKGTASAKFLAFFVTADGKPFSTDVDVSP